MNIDEITTKRLGGFPQVGTAVRDPEHVPDGWPIGQQPTKSCAHDFLFLRGKEIVESDKPVQYEATFYCRRCLEYREVKR